MLQTDNKKINKILNDIAIKFNFMKLKFRNYWNNDAKEDIFLLILRQNSKCDLLAKPIVRTATDHFVYGTHCVKFIVDTTYNNSKIQWTYSQKMKNRPDFLQKGTFPLFLKRSTEETFSKPLKYLSQFLNANNAQCKTNIFIKFLYRCIDYFNICIHIHTVSLTVSFNFTSWIFNARCTRYDN